MENYTHIQGSFYIVRTQAGLNQAIKDWNENYSSKDLISYPTSYPSVVVFSLSYSGNINVIADCIHVNTLKRSIMNA